MSQKHALNLSLVIDQISQDRIVTVSRQENVRKTETALKPDFWYFPRKLTSANSGVYLYLI